MAKINNANLNPALIFFSIKKFSIAILHLAGGIRVFNTDLSNIKKQISLRTPAVQKKLI
jgi:hypothetical protein